MLALLRVMDDDDRAETVLAAITMRESIGAEKESG
jgi:hypothetical protein